VTALLQAWHAGDATALNRLTPLVYDELRRRARYYLRDERRRDTLRPTALINEVYLRLVRLPQLDWRDRAQFFALAACQMRRILVDAARARRYQKRGGGAVNVTFDEALAGSERSPDLVALDDALAALAVSTDTVTRDWQMAKLWLRRELGRRKAGP
jgi:RNA polymerase sigma factor (TIGR02999 family)